MCTTNLKDMSDVTRCLWPRGLVPVDPVDPVDGHDLRVVPQDGHVCRSRGRFLKTDGNAGTVPWSSCQVG